MTSDEQKEFNPWEFMVSYVDERKIIYINKPEWEQLFVYTWIKNKYDKALIGITPKEMYEIGEKFNLDFKQVATLLKKCNKIDNEKFNRHSNGNQDSSIIFKYLIDNNAISNISPTENLTVRIKLLNTIVYEEVLKILNLQGIYSDTSFSKDILMIPTEGFCKLVTGKDNFSLTDKAKSTIKELCTKLKSFFGRDNRGEEKISEEIKGKLAALEATKDIKGLFNIVKTLKDLVSPMKSIISGMTFKAVTDSMDEIDLSDIISDSEMC